MGLSDWHSAALEKSAYDKYLKDYNAHWVRYNIGIYPADAGIESVVQAIEGMRCTCNRQAEPLRTALLEWMQTFDEGLAAKSAEGGRRLQVMQQEQVIDQMQQRLKNKDFELDDALNYTEQKQVDPYSGRRG